MASPTKGANSSSERQTATGSPQSRSSERSSNVSPSQQKTKNDQVTYDSQELKKLREQINEKLNKLNAYEEVGKKTDDIDGTTDVPDSLFFKEFSDIEKALESKSVVQLRNIVVDKYARLDEAIEKSQSLDKLKYMRNLANFTSSSVSRLTAEMADKGIYTARYQSFGFDMNYIYLLLTARISNEYHPTSILSDTYNKLIRKINSMVKQLQDKIKTEHLDAGQTQEYSDLILKVNDQMSKLDELSIRMKTADDNIKDNMERAKDLASENLLKLIGRSLAMPDVSDVNTDDLSDAVKSPEGRPSENQNQNGGYKKAWKLKNKRLVRNRA